MELAFFYFLLLGFAILMYVVLDGFDLGLGILYPWFDQEDQRDQMMRSISHVWDGNETWLVFGGVILFGAFPAAYSAILSTLYVPIMIMLIALIFRGVAFEYRFKAHRSKRWWDRAFSIGSTVAAFCQGLMLGAVVQGVEAGAIDGSSLNWLSPFSILTAFSVMAGYALLACCYLHMKSRGAIRFRAAKLGRVLVVAVMAAMFVVSVWTLIAEPQIRERWFSGFNLLLLSPLPLMSLWVGQKLLRDLGRHRNEQQSFFLAAALFVLGLAGLVVGLFPYLVPRQLTIWQAQAPASSLEFMLPGVLIFVPLICAYTLWGYRIFSGKVEDFEEGY